MTGILDSRYSWARLSISLLIAAVGNVGMWALVVVLPLVEAEFGVDRSEAALPYTATMIGFGLGNVLMGRVVDRIGVARALSIAAVMISLGHVGAALAPSIIPMAIAQVVIGIGAATFFGPLIADISHWFMRRRGIAVGIVASGNYLAGGLWPLVLSPILAMGDWRLAYWVIAVAVLVLVFPLALLLRRKLPADAHIVADQVAAVRTQATRLSPLQLQLLLAVAGVACCVAMSMPQVHIVSFCVDLGYGPAVGAGMLSVMLFAGVVSRLVSGLLADWLGGVRTLLIGSAGQMLALALYLPSTGLTGLYLVSLIFGLSQGGIIPSYAIIVREYLPAREAGQRIGMVIMATIFGMALGGWLTGWIYDQTGSYQMAILNGIGWNAVNILIVLLVLGSTRKRREALAA